MAQIVAHQPAAEDVGLEERVALLGHDLLPLAPVGFGQVDGDDPALIGIEVG